MNREQQERLRKLRVGVFVIAGLAAFLGLVYLLGARARLFEARYTVHADFTEVGGIAEGATVRLAGVQIGRVTGVHLPSRPGGKVRVDMSITRQYAEMIRKSSVARIETQGLLGDKIIEITVGSGDTPTVRAGEVIQTRDPTDIGQVLTEGAATVKSVAALAQTLRAIADTLARSRLIEETTATVADARRVAAEFARTGEQISRAAERVTALAGQAEGVIGQAKGVIGKTEGVMGQVAGVVGKAEGVVDQARQITGGAGRVIEGVGRIVDEVEKGKGWAHALVYERPVALERVDELITTTQALLDRIERGEGAIGVFTSAESTATSQAMLEDARTLARNLREISDRIAGGKGTLGSLVRDEPGDGGIREASRDLRAAIANLREITEKINDGEGSLGALIADPTLYERLVSILEGAQRSFLLRGLLRSLGRDRDQDRGRASPEPRR